LFVLDQKSAYDFYVNKLGFKVHTDQEFGEGMRWLTVQPPQQPDLEITLLELKAGMMLDQESVDALKKLITGGKIAPGVLEVDDCKATCEELKAKGVKIVREPQEQFYGIEALLEDDSGYIYSMTQPKPH
jgi:uncharacterized glyoxalase superfamily protein PhnB